MTRIRSNPEIARIPAEIHAQALKLGLVVEVYTEVMAGHGITGLIAWSVGIPVLHGDWTDITTLRSGRAMTSVYAFIDLRNALDSIERGRS